MLDYENVIQEDKKEIINEVKDNINPNKAPRFDLIIGKILKQLPS